MIESKKYSEYKQLQYNKRGEIVYKSKISKILFDFKQYQQQQKKLQTSTAGY